jgi:hypothetical protein
MLQIAPSTYYAAKRGQPSARELRDAVMMQILMVLWVANRKVYGAHKLWKAAAVADTTSAVTRSLGSCGSWRSKGSAGNVARCSPHAPTPMRCVPRIW